jgi:cytochrome c55X
LRHVKPRVLSKPARLSLNQVKESPRRAANHRLMRWFFILLLTLLPLAVLAEPPTAERQRALLRMLRQDCGSCHGMQLTGGLGPPLTRTALAERSHEAVFASIYHGRPGTPMPPWRNLITEPEAQWLAQRLLGGIGESEGR